MKAQNHIPASANKALKKVKIHSWSDSSEVPDNKTLGTSGADIISST